MKVEKGRLQLCTRKLFWDSGQPFGLAQVTQNILLHMHAVDKTDFIEKLILDSKQITKLEGFFSEILPVLNIIATNIT